MRRENVQLLNNPFTHSNIKIDYPSNRQLGIICNRKQNDFLIHVREPFHHNLKQKINFLNKDDLLCTVAKLHSWHKHLHIWCTVGMTIVCVVTI